MYSINKSKVYDFDIYSYFCDDGDRELYNKEQQKYIDRKKITQSSFNVNRKNGDTSSDSEYEDEEEDEDDYEEDEEEDSYQEEEEEEEESNDDDGEPKVKKQININTNAATNSTQLGCYVNNNVNNNNETPSITITKEKEKRKQRASVKPIGNNYVTPRSSINHSIDSSNGDENGSNVRTSVYTYSKSDYSYEEGDFDGDGSELMDASMDQQLQKKRSKKKKDKSKSRSSGSIRVVRPPQSSRHVSKLSSQNSGNSINIQSQLNRYTSSDFKRKDWNNEFQSLLALPNTEQKFSKLSHLARDFVFAAKTYATIIINELCLPFDEKSLQPVDMGGFAGGLKYYCQGILFKFAMDTRLSEDCWMYGGDIPRDDYASKAASNELKGLISYYMAGVSGLHYPLIALIDYKGFRIIALSLLPINAETIRYGSSDSGTIVHHDIPDLNEKMKEAGKRINLKPHTVGSVPEFTKVLPSPGDLEAHLGSDNRYYVIDFSRTFPPEALLKRDNINKRSIFYNLLRPEFVAKWAKPLCSDAFTGWQRLDQDKQNHNKEVEEATDYLLNSVVRQMAEKLDREFKGNIITPFGVGSIGAGSPITQNQEEPSDFNMIKTQFANKFLPILQKRFESGGLGSMHGPPITMEENSINNNSSGVNSSPVMGDSMDTSSSSINTNNSQTGVPFIPEIPVPYGKRTTNRSLNQVKNETPKMLLIIIEEMHRLGINLRHMGRLRFHSISVRLRDLLLLEMTARSIKSIIRDTMRNKMKEVQGLSEEPFKQVVIAIFNQVLDLQSPIWNRILDTLKSKYEMAFLRHNIEGELVEEDLKGWMENINSKNLFERLQLLTGIALSPIAQQEFSRDHFSFQFVDSDILEIYANVKHMNIVDYAEGMALSMAAQTKTGRERLRLLKMATTKFQSSLKSNPDNFDCICQLGRALILQAESINTVAGSFGKNVYLKTLEEAALKFKDAIQIAPTFYRAYYELAHLYILIAQYYHGTPFKAQRYYKMASVEFDHSLAHGDNKDIESEKLKQQHQSIITSDESVDSLNSSHHNHRTKHPILDEDGKELSFIEGSEDESQQQGDEDEETRFLGREKSLFKLIFKDTRKLFEFGFGSSQPIALMGVIYLCEVLEKYRPKDAMVKILLAKSLIYRPTYHEDMDDSTQREIYISSYNKFNQALLIDSSSVKSTIYEIGKDMWMNSKMGSKRLFFPTALIFRLLVQHYNDNRVYSMYSDALIEIIRTDTQRTKNDTSFLVELTSLYEKLMRLDNEYVRDKVNTAVEEQGQDLCDFLMMAHYSNVVKERLKKLVVNCKKLEMHRTLLTDSALMIAGELFVGLESLNLSYCPHLTDYGISEFLSVYGRPLVDLNLSGSLITASTISKISTFCSQIQCLDTQNCPMVSTESFSTIAQLQKLKKLDLSKCKISNESIAAFGTLPLSELIIKNENRISDEAFKIFPWEHLVSLDLTACSKISDNTFLKIPVCPLFESLILESCYNITDATVNALSLKMPKLRKLSLKGCKFITDSSIISLCERNTQLQDLKLARCHSISELALEAIAKNLATSLQSIDISMCPQLQEPPILNLISSCKQLQSINISENPNISSLTIKAINLNLLFLKHLRLDTCPNINDDGSLIISCNTLMTLSIQKLQISHQSFLNLCNILPNITYLSLKSCLHLNDLSFSALVHFPNLEWLDLSYNHRVLDNSLLTICKHLKKLKYLDLSFCIRITTKSFMLIGKHLLQLDTLILSGCANLNDTCLKYISENLTQLRHLDISGATLITDYSVYVLANHLVYLEKLYLRECNNITQPALDYLKQQCTLFRLTRLSLNSLPLVGELKLASPESLLKPIKVNEGTTHLWRLIAAEKRQTELEQQKLRHQEEEKIKELKKIQEKQQQQLLQLQQVNSHLNNNNNNSTSTHINGKLNLAPVKFIPQSIKPVEEYRPFTEKLTYIELLKRPKNLKIDFTNLEKYLPDGEFEHLFGMTWDKFDQLPKWKRDTLKKNANLY